MYALIDSNNFFVSCERLFRPDIIDVPTIVLSSNDGCAVARSNEAKALGIKMGEPLHILKDRFTIIEGPSRQATLQPPGIVKPPLVVFSANFQLYGDVSRRIARTLAHITPRIELYSIDEAFLDLGELNIDDYTVWGRALGARIHHDIGVPVSVGIAPTKTLCKLAADYAKHHPESQGAYFVVERELLLADTPIQALWGIGWRLAPKLKAEGIRTALELARLRPQHAEQLMGVHGRRMVAELCGTSCIPLQSIHKPQQVVSRGRQFGHDTGDFSVIEAAIASMTTSATAALRREGQLATRASARITTHRLKPGYQAISRDAHFYTPTANTGTIASQLTRLVQHDFDSHLSYHKVEVTLWDLLPDTQLQTDVFGTVDSRAHTRSTMLMRTLDALNTKHGNGTLRYAAEDLSHAWHPRKTLASQSYTTDWPQLPEIHATKY